MTTIQHVVTDNLSPEELETVQKCLPILPNPNTCNSIYYRVALPRPLNISIEVIRDNILAPPKRETINDIFVIFNRIKVAQLYKWKLNRIDR